MNHQLSDSVSRLGERKRWERRISFSYHLTYNLRQKSSDLAFDNVSFSSSPFTLCLAFLASCVDDYSSLLTDISRTCVSVCSCYFKNPLYFLKYPNPSYLSMPSLNVIYSEAYVLSPQTMSPFLHIEDLSTICMSLR